MAPVMMRVAWFCTLLTRSKLDLAVALAPCCHAILKYWSDSTSVQSLESHSDSTAPHVMPASFFMRASYTLALASAFLVCCFQVSHLSKVTPR